MCSTELFSIDFLGGLLQSLVDGVCLTNESVGLFEELLQHFKSDFAYKSIESTFGYLFGWSLTNWLQQTIATPKKPFFIINLLLL